MKVYRVICGLTDVSFYTLDKERALDTGKDWARGHGSHITTTVDVIDADVDEDTEELADAFWEAEYELKRNIECVQDFAGTEK